MSGGYLGGELVKNSGRVKSTETSAATGAITNQFSDTGDPVGGGLVAGYNFTPWNNNWVVGPFASFDWLRLTINHTFPTGFYLGTTTNWIANLGGKAGYMVAPNWQVYGLAGAAWLNESLNINFPAGFSTKSATTPGFTLGLGTEYHPSTWQVAGHPISLFAQYQHTWYANANFNTPTPASPGFNYAFKRDDDMLKFGVIVH
jgi:outer membrane autotransporter protein